MMISPEDFYQASIHGKTVEQIADVIRKLERDIKKLEKQEQKTCMGIEVYMHPSREVRLICTRQYIEVARQAYSGAAGFDEPK